jgi:hypothetical protein
LYRLATPLLSEAFNKPQTLLALIMFALKILPGYFLASLLIVPLAQAQKQLPPSTTAEPSPVGLLVARMSHARRIEILGSPSVVQYETLWVVRDASGARVVSTLPDVIVPRKDGFWRLGIAHVCHLSAPEKGVAADHGSVTTDDMAYASPADRAPQVIDGNPTPFCDSATAKRLFDDSYQPYAGDDPNPRDPNAPTHCGWQNLWFSSVLPDLVSLSSYSGNSEDCGPHGGRSWQDAWLQSPDDMASPAAQPTAHIQFDSVFGSEGHRAWIRAVTAVGGPTGDSCLSDAPVEELDDQSGWSLVHVAGKWLAYAFAQRGETCSAGGYAKVAVPRTLTHAAPLPVAWTALEKQLPGISDAYLSPSGSTLLAIVSKNDPHPTGSPVIAVSVFDFSENKLGAKLIDLPVGDVVMAEWATRRFVQSWTDTLSALQSHGLPAPIVKPATPAN